MNDALNPDLYLSSPCPSCPIPWPQTPEEAHAIAVLYIVTWSGGLAFLVWKDRDSVRISFVLVRHLFQWGIRSMRITLLAGAQRENRAHRQFSKHRERE